MTRPKKSPTPKPPTRPVHGAPAASPTTIPAPITRAVLYARFSSDNQREESIDAQVRAVQEYARRNILHIVKTYVDRAKSATSDKRPEFQNMIADSSLRKFDVIIVHKLDRFSRDKYDFAHYKRILKTNGVRLVSVLENLDDSPESLILESVLEGMAAYYSKNLSREVMKGLKETDLQGKHTGGLPPLGYDVDGITKEYVLNQTEAKTVRLIYDLYLRGIGYNQIIKELNLRGMVSKKGQPFAKNSIGSILRNEKYAGVYTFNRTVEQPKGGRSNKSKPEDQIIKLPNRIPAIVTPEEFEAVQAKMNANPHSGGRQTAKETYLLSGLVVCGVCLATTGHPHKMVGTVRYCGRGKSKYVTYHCNQRHSKKRCTNKEIRREYIESYILDQMQEKLFGADVMPLLVEQVNEAIREKTNKAESAGAGISAILALVLGAGGLDSDCNCRQSVGLLSVSWNQIVTAGD